MHKILYIFIIILCLLLLAPITIPQYNTDETLEKYRQAIAENKNYRTFSFEKGVASIYPLLKDKDGYAWYLLYYSDRNKPNEYCMFKGTEFENMTGSFPKAERDSLLGSAYSKYRKDLYLFGKHYLYKWEGYKFTKYKFPDNDTIVSCNVMRKKVLCIGREGYGLLDNNKWYYYGKVRLGIKQVGDIVTNQMLSPSGVISSKSYKFPNDSINLFNLNSYNKLYHLKYQAVDTTKEKRIWRNDLYLKSYSKGSVDSLFVVDAQTLNEVDTGYLHPIVINTITDELFMIYLPGTSLIYSVNNGSIRQVNLGLPLGSTIQLITQLHSGDTWVSYVYHEKIYISSMDLEKVAVGHPFFVSNNETSSNKLFNVIIGKDNISFATRDPMTAETETFYVFNEQTNTIDKINVPDLAHTYGNERIIKNGKMIYSRRDKEVSDLHKIIIYDPQTAQQDSFSLIDVAASVDVIDYDADSGFLLVKGIDQFKRIPLSQMIDKEKSFMQKYDNCISLQMNGYNLIINSVSEFSFVGNSTVRQNQHPKLVLMKQEGKYISKVTEINDASFSDVDKQNEVLYLSVGSKRYSFDLTNKSLKQIHDYDVPTMMTIWHGRYLCMDEELNYLEVIDGVKIESSFEPIKALLDSTLKGTGISIKELLNQQYYSPQYISNEVVFFPALVCSYTYKHDLDKIVSGSQGMLEKETEKELENRSTFPCKAQIIGEIGKKFSVQIPAMLYNLRTNDYIMKPEYLFVRSFQKPGRTDVYVAHRFLYKSENYVRISKLEEGKLKLSSSDFMMKIQDKDIFDVDLFNQKSGFICRYKKQLYYYQYGWKGINCDGFNKKDLSYIIDVQWHKDDIWIVYEDCLVRYSIPLKRSFIIDSKHCLPERLFRFYTNSDDKPYILANDGIYSINMESSVNLHIPWFYANDIMLSATKTSILNPRQNNIKIPIDILNVLFPEQLSVSYRLLGYENNWKVREYTPYLEYPKLPAGKYEFQVKAISPFGAVSKVNSIKFEIKHPFYATWWAYLIYVGMGSAAIYGIFKLRTRQLQRRNLALEKTVELRTSELKERQQRIQESIEYASLIQKSILPQREELIQRFRQHFVIWKPRDIVGGDFYWLYENEAGETFFAVIDCTGHGVPGALLSMTVNSLLDKLVKDGGICSPAEILTRMHREIGAALHQTEAQTQQDGIEIALIKINPSSQTLTFSGGGLHLLHYDPESKDTSHLRGNKHGLGGLKWHAELVFEEQVIPYAEKQRIYLYTDGILDQPVAEAEKPKRLGSVAWLEFLGSIAGLPMEEQETSCNELIGRMLACHEQRDDITVVGIEL